MTCCRKVSTGGKPKPKTKTAPSGAVPVMPLNGLLAGAHGLHEFFVALRLAALNDCDGLDFATLHGEDRHLGVLAVALVVEADVAGGAGEADLLQLRQVLFRIRG